MARKGLSSMMGRRFPFVMILAMCLAEIAGMAAIGTFPALLPTFQSEWSLTNWEAGLIGGVYFAGYLVAVAVLTSLTDRTDPKWIYLSAMALSAISAIGFAFLAEGVVTASLWRALQGVGLGGTYMPGLRALTDSLPEESQSRGVAFYTASFGIGFSLSIIGAGEIAALTDWRWAYGLAALGPVAALVAAAIVLPASPPAQEEKPAASLLDFRPALSNRRALAFTLGYCVHNWELFGLRTWLVSFLDFVQGQQPAGATGLNWSATTLAALVVLVGLPSSVSGNEFAHRFGRRQVLIVAMTLSAIVGIAFGIAGSMLPFVVVVALAFLYGVTVVADSATMTAGVVAAAEPRFKGQTMAMYSMIGFVGSFLGPLAFGAVLDAGGGEDSGFAWGLAFASLSSVILIGPVLMMTMARRAENEHAAAQQESAEQSAAQRTD